MPIQQMLLGVGAVATKTYVDDVFSTYVYEGDGNSSRNITNNIDLLTEGGLVWYKSRSAGKGHRLVDTERGVTKVIESNDSNAEAVEATGLKAFLTNGFTVGSDDTINESGGDQASFSFRKAPGFFDVVTYTGNGSNRTISHSLGSVPGMILIKNLSSSENWIVYHHTLKATHHVRLNQTNASASSMTMFNDTEPTASVFSVGTNSGVNTNGDNYVAYVFAGGESTAATANSASFAADVCYTDSSSNYTLGTSDFTLEYWYKADSNPSSGNSSYIVDYNDDDWATRIQPDGTHQYMVGDTARITSTTSLGEGQWNHIAIVRSSGTSRMYVNGVQEGGTYSDSTDYSFTQFYMGRRYNGTNQLYGKISNLRLVVGTAVYTSSFRPPTEPLTNITNTKLLGLNSSSVTGTTVGTIQISGNTDLSPTASTDSPFDDPAGFVFGDAGDQGIIKCGSYVGNGSATGPEINLGWEPQFLIVKQTNSSGNNWRMWDSMRGIVTGGNDESLYPSTSAAADSVSDRLELTPTGFKITRNDSAFNGNGDTYIFLAIRRLDGYVGKPPELGTGVFAMDTGGSSSTIPNYDSGFPVDFAIYKTVASSGHAWWVHSRLTEGKELQTNSTSGQSDWANGTFDSNTGWSKDGAAATVQSWMWKRHAGFDVVTITNYDSTTGPTYTWHPHSLGKKPEMIWVKRRDSSQEWWVYHHGANGGTNPWNNYLQLQSNAAEGALTGFFGESGPTATAFSLKRGAMTDGDFIFMLFASVDGISKVGYYDGSSTSSFLTITTGFQPRFLMVKRINDSGPWLNVDTTRGWVNGDDKVNYFNLTAASEEYGMSYPTSTGFVLDVDASFNMANNKYIYYCHA